MKKLLAVVLVMVPGILVLFTPNGLAQRFTHNVIGSGEVSPSVLLSFRTTMSAHEDSDGVVWGMVIVDFDSSTTGRIMYHTQVDCLVVNGNEALVGGMVTNSTNEGAIPVGSFHITRVSDGEGPGEDQLDNECFSGDENSICCISGEPCFPKNRIDHLSVECTDEFLSLGEFEVQGNFQVF